MPPDYSNVSIPYLSNEEIRRRADEFCELYWGNKVPIDIELIAERNLTLLIIPIPDLRYRAHTDGFLSGNLKEIVYDANSSDVRAHFSIAHEIGHFVLHKDTIAKLRPNSYDEWKEVQQAIPDAIWGHAEYQAREFAGRLLVPRNLLIEELKALKPQIDKAKIIAPDLELPVIKAFVSVKLARRFFVSGEVIMRRLDAEQISPIQD